VSDALERLDELVHRADLDELVRLIDTCTSTRDWPTLRAVRDRCRAALDTGRQLWPAATLAEYRLALWAPAEWAAGVLGEDGGRFSIGPLTEVVAQHHTFAELGPFLESGPRRAFVAHERVLRGETIDDGMRASLLDVIDLPWQLQPWEPAYVLATYSDEGIEAPSPDALPPSAFEPIVPATADVEVLDDDAFTRSVRDLVEPWTASSNGRAESVCVDSDRPADALTALGVRQGRLAPLTHGHALQWLAWAGASGGAFGRRRGGALGRFGAWWVLGALAGDEPGAELDPDELGAVAAGLRWWWWDANEPQSGWELRLVVVDPEIGQAWAINARDST
jgi:hypothetical protein